MTGPALDLARRSGWILMRDGDRSLETAVGIVLAEPGCREPVVESSGDCGAEIRVRLEVAEGTRQQDGVRDAVLLHQLLPQELRITSRRPTVRRLAIQAGAMDRVAEETAAAAGVTVAERRAHEVADLVRRARRRVHVAINDTGSHD